MILNFSINTPVEQKEDDQQKYHGLFLELRPRQSTEEFLEQRANNINIDYIRNMLTTISYPWRYCGDTGEGCRCAQIWSLPMDIEIACTDCDSEEMGIETTHEHKIAHAKFIAESPDMIEYLLNRIEELERRNNG